MKKAGKITKKKREQVRHLDDVFADFRNEIANAMKPWSSGSGWPLSDFSRRVPLLDMVDKGDHYELQVEVPGIEKEKINIKATPNTVEISAEQSNLSEEQRKGYIYSERTSNSFYRMIPIPEQVVQSKIDAKFNNGILTIKLPKDDSFRDKQQTTKVEVK